MNEISDCFICADSYFYGLHDGLTVIEKGDLLTTSSPIISMQDEMLRPEPL